MSDSSKSTAAEYRFTQKQVAGRAAETTSPSNGPHNVIGALKNQARDFVDATEVFNLKVLRRHMGVELLFDAKQQLDEFLRIEDTGFEQVRLCRRNLDVELLREQEN
jgi:acyl transferase domain-containing protein